MRVLAIDTALDACSVALFDTVAGQPIAVESIEMSRGHAEMLLPLVDRVMKTADAKFDTVDRIVTTVGPGSFTGLRVGISAARGFGVACQKPVVGVTTLAALTAPYVNDKEAVPVVAAINAQHGNFYLHMVGAGGRSLVSPRVVSLDDAIRAVAIGLVRIVGSGAALIANHWPSKQAPAPLLVDSRLAPDITWVARIGATLDPQRARPCPLYLRPPDARPQESRHLPRR